MWTQVVQFGIAGFATVCALMVVRTVIEVLPELLALRDSDPHRGGPLPVSSIGVDSGRARRL